MAKKTWAILRGFTTKRTKAEIKAAGLFDLERFVKEELNKIHVPFKDDCEDCPVSDSEAPVRYNIDNDTIEYWDGATWFESSIIPPVESVTVTQTSSETSTVEVNGSKGVITTVPLTTTPGRYFEFELINASILPSSVIQLTGLNSRTGQLNVSLGSVSAGSAVIIVGNVDNNEPFDDVVKIHFNIS